VGLDWDEEEESTHVFPSSHPPSHDSGSSGMRASSRDMSKRPAPSNVDYSKPPSTDTLRLDGVLQFGIVPATAGWTDSWLASTPGGLGGVSLIVQGALLNPQARNGVYETTNAHRFVF
jgi:hypothetical protein